MLPPEGSELLPSSILFSAIMASEMKDLASVGLIFMMAALFFLFLRRKSQTAFVSLLPP